MERNSQNYDFNDKGAAVRSLQRKLRVLSNEFGNIPEVFVDGIYGIETEQAVGALQSAAGMTVTGFPDYRTFVEIEKRYNDVMKNSPESGAGYLPPFDRLAGNMINYLDRFDDVLIMQCILNKLSVEDENLAVESTGVFDKETLRAVNYMQRLLGMEEISGVDRRFWNCIVKLEKSKSSYSI